MKCHSYLQLMHDYLDNEITIDEESRLREHLRTCTHCGQHFHELKKAEALVNSTIHVEAPQNFTLNVMNKLPKEKNKMRVKRWFQAHPMLTAAAVFLFLMLGSLTSIWNDHGQLSVSKQENLEIIDQLVVVPEGKIVEGDIVVKNGDIRIEGEVRGDVVVINGDKYLASAGHVTGEIQVIDQAFNWIWYNIKNIFSSLLN